VINKRRGCAQRLVVKEKKKRAALLAGPRGFTTAKENPSEEKKGGGRSKEVERQKKISPQRDSVFGRTEDSTAPKRERSQHLEQLG